MQVPSPFEYERASSVDEAIALLQRHGEGARLIAGGHSLLPLMKLRLASPEVLVDINALTDLQRVQVDTDTVRIGAMVRHAELLASAVVGEHFRLLHEAEQVIADPVVRNRGTVGGSLCQADPAEDLSAAFGALRAEVVIRGAEGAIRGRAADEESIELAAVRASEECSPTTDQRGPADYKRALVAELVRRVLRTAIARSRGEEGWGQGGDHDGQRDPG